MINLLSFTGQEKASVSRALHARKSAHPGLIGVFKVDLISDREGIREVGNSSSF